MDLYTLTDTFLAKDVIDEYISAIWTERYSQAGDVQIVTAASSEIVSKLQEGTYLALRGSKEVMIIDTASVEDKKLTVVGSTLPVFLNERIAWFYNSADPSAAPESRVSDYTSDDVGAGEFIANVVNLCVIDPFIFTGDYADANLEWDLEVIPSLELGPVDTASEVKQLNAVVGPLYDSIVQVAQKEGVGFTLYLESADADDGYVLKFTTYRGVDHSTGGAGDLVRLVPDMDTLSNVKELRSIANYKNVAYVYYQGIISVHYEDPDNIPEGMNRRVLVTDAANEPIGHKEMLFGAGMGGSGMGTIGPGYAYTVVDSGDIAAFRAQNARDALANHNYIRAVDGQTSPNNDYQFGEHYSLGDIIELVGLSGSISKARITEYIRSEDQQGEKAYPTISVIAPTEGV